MQSSNDLQHSGVLGMKWGIRRYQNKDGTLTEEGKQRYAKKYPYQDAETGSLNERGQRDFMKAAKKGKLDYKRLSDKDLDMINNRFNKEKQYQRNVEEYEKGTFKYRAKEAVLNRIKGKSGGGDGKKGGGNSVLKSLLVSPIEKAIKDAFNFKDNGGGGGEGKKGGNDAVDNSTGMKKLLNDLSAANKEKQIRLAESGRAILGDAVFDQRTRDIAAQRKRINDMRKEEQLNERAARSGIIIAHRDELTHYGIIGQKWGVRRFQNADRTLTAAGKERYGHGSQGTKSGRTKDLVGESTNSEFVYERSCRTSSQDPKIRHQLDTIISNSKDPTVKKAVEHANEWKSASEKLNNAFSTFSARLRKDRGGKEWDGDGTEEHWEMEKRYPEYRDISRNEQIALKNLVESSITLAKSKEFANVKGFENSKNYFDSYPEYGNWFKKGDQRAYAIAMTLLGGRDTKDEYFEVWPEYFIESFDGSGNKIDTGMFDTK